MNYTLKFPGQGPVDLSMTAYRFAVGTWLLLTVFALVLAGVWAHYLLGPSVSIYDLGAPQLRAAA